MEILKLGVVILLLDSVYLSQTKKYFDQLVKRIQGSSLEINIKGAIMSYSLIIFSLYYFIIRENKKPLDAFFLGLSIYAI